MSKSKGAFWQAVPILWNYKRPLIFAACGALVSAACFGAGLSMLNPLLVLLLRDEGEGAGLRERLSEVDTLPVVGPALRPAADAVAGLIPEDRFFAFVLVVVGVACLTVVGSVGRFVHELFTLTTIHRAAADWRSRLLRHSLYLPSLHFSVHGSGDHMSRIVGDTSRLAGGYHAILGKGVLALLTGLAGLIVALFFDFGLTLLALLAAPIAAVLLKKLGTRIRRASKRALAAKGAMVGVLSEMLNGLRVVKAFNAERHERRRFLRINRELFQQQMYVRRIRALSSPLLETLGLFAVMLVAILAAYYIFRAGREPANFITALAGLAAGASALKPLTSLHNKLHEAHAAAERVLGVLNFTPEPIGPYSPPDAPDPPRHQNSIAFRDVHFYYPGSDRPALEAIDLEVAHGERIAIVGGNGSGKTTLTSLVPRFIDPTQGRVLLDGQDIARLNLRALRRQIAMVTQQTVLFQDTVLANIAYGQANPDRQAVIDAAQAAYAHEFITELPEAYDTRLGPWGEGLSGGQRQRLCIARAILLDPAILILDEATSQIDADSEQKINQALRAFCPGRTTFLIAHRLSSVIDADRIVVMHAGRILDVGPHHALLERCETYRTLTQSQLQPAHTP